MSHRTDIRNDFATLLSAATLNPVEVSRAAPVSEFPYITVRSGIENRLVTDATRDGTPTEYELIVALWAGGSDSDAQLDTMIDTVDVVVSTNRSTAAWSSARVQGVTGPEDEPSEDERVAMCEISILFKIEV